jgi:hypothetical protein
MDYTSNNSTDPFNIAVRDALLNDRFVVGVSASLSPSITDRVWNIQNPSVTLSIEYIPPTQTVTLDQRLSNNTQVGKLRKWEGTQFTQYPFINPGTQFVFPVNSVQTIQGDQAIYSNEKYNNWNADKTDVNNHHVFPINTQTNILTSKFEGTQSGITIKNNLEATGIDGGEIRFKDPWLIDYADPDYANTLRNRGMDNDGPDKLEFKTQTSPFSPDYTSPFNGDVYKGIFTGQLFNSGTYYSVGSLSEQTINVNGQNRKFYPFKWSGTGVTLQGEYNLETGIVFTSSNAVATATLKGQLMSNSTTGISSNSQRKMVRTDNGIYHVVYESMGSVFYTYSLSSNFASDWSKDEWISDNAKNPAIEYDGNNIIIVFEYYDPTYSSNAIINKIQYTADASNNYYFVSNSDEEIAYYPSTYLGSAKPVISYNVGQLVIVYRKNSTEGLKEKTKWYNSGTQQWTWGNEVTIPGTNSNSINPAIIGANGNIHIAFESLSTIKYKFGYSSSSNGPWNFSTALATLSTGCGFNQNKYPSISMSNYTVPAVMVSWLGIYDQVAEKRIAKEQDESIRRYAAVAKVGYGTSWGGFSNFSNNVNYTSNGSLNSSSGSILAWSESNGQTTKYVKRKSNGTYDPITSLLFNSASAKGIHTLVSNGSAFDNIKVMVFNNSTSAPYLLNKCTNDFSEEFLEKVGETETNSISYGRSGIVEKDGVEFLFNIGDVSLAGQTVKFIERVDTLPVVSLDDLNSAARTEPFNLDAQSELVFSNYYYVVNKNMADSTLSDQFCVTFKCELVNATTNLVVGTFDNVTFNKTNVNEYANPSYLVDCSGIEPGSYYLRLFTSSNEEINLFVSDIQRDDIVLEKSNLQVKNFKGEGIPLTYDLTQNFPNPFNPSTTIRYQIPQDGIVTLKIYDILGSEVATLVNEQKPAGKYEVNFNARSLASGIYIYKIQAGEFTASKKLMLLK